MKKEIEDALVKRAQAVAKRCEDLDELIFAPEVAADGRLYLSLVKEKKGLEALNEAYLAYSSAQEEAEKLKGLSACKEFSEEEIAEELSLVLARKECALQSIKKLVMPASYADMRAAVVELKAKDAKSGELLGKLAKAYLAYGEAHKYNGQIIAFDGENIENATMATIEFDVAGTYGALRRESGLHRGAYGKKGTATVEVLVMPVQDEADVPLNEKDLRVDIYHSSGAGGQNINKVETAVRLTHIPTGIVVTCQNERSQLQNRAKAKEIMRARLFEHQRALEEAKRIGDKNKVRATMKIIRTYDFTLDATTDEYGFSVPLHNVLVGKLDELIEHSALTEAEGEI